NYVIAGRGAGGNRKSHVAVCVGIERHRCPVETESDARLERRWADNVRQANLYRRTSRCRCRVEAGNLHAAADTAQCKKTTDGKLPNDSLHGWVPLPNHGLRLCGLLIPLHLDLSLADQRYGPRGF